MESVRPAVVQVLIRIKHFDPLSALPVDKPIQDCFHTGICVAGTGFFINDSGDVITASHVADAVQGIIGILETKGIHAEAEIGVSAPNIESKSLTVASTAINFPVIFLAEDAEHDVAAFHPTRNPFTNTLKLFPGNFPEPKATFVHLTTTRPQDGEEVFACGFPFGDSGLVTTSGAIASAWKTEVLVTGKAAGKQIPVDTFLVDLRINPGNSGGPLFRKSDETVIGMVVELKGSLGVAVPAKYIAEFLKNNHIPHSNGG